MTASFIRAYSSSLERTGPRQLTGRLVPYNVATEVADELEGGTFDIYHEGFRLGAFMRQANTKEKGRFQQIEFTHTHRSGLGFLGHFVDLREAADGLYGDAMVLSRHSQDVEELLDAGVDELSVEFQLVRGANTDVDAQGVRWRTRAHLNRVALEPRGAYSGARVLAYRSEMDEVAKEQAEADAAAAAQAEADQKAADEAAAAEKATQERAEAAAAETAERSRKWADLTGRLDDEKAKQERLVRDYGLTVPGERFSPHG